jgi:hypothetical protein
LIHGAQSGTAARERGNGQGKGKMCGKRDRTIRYNMGKFRRAKCIFIFLCTVQHKRTTMKMKSKNEKAKETNKK